MFVYVSNSNLSVHYLFNLGRYSSIYIESIHQGKIHCYKLLSLIINIYLNILIFSAVKYVSKREP